MSNYGPGDNVTFSFPLTDATGAAANGTSMVGRMVRENTPDGAVTVTLNNPATGNYTGACTIPGGYALGDRVRVEVSGSQSSIPLPWTTVWETRLDSTVTSRSNHTAADVATAVLVTPANKIATDGSGRVTVGSIIATAIQSIWEYTFSGDMAKNWILGSNNLLVILESRLTLANITGAVPTAVQIRDSVWNGLLSAYNTAGTYGKWIKDNLNATITSRLDSSFGTSISNTFTLATLLPGSLGIMGHVVFRARDDGATPAANQLYVDESMGSGPQVGQFITLAVDMYGYALGPPGRQSGLIWEITAVAVDLITLTPYGHAISVQAWLNDESAVPQGVLLQPDSPLLHALRWGNMVEGGATPQYTEEALANGPQGTGSGSGTERIYVFGPLGITALDAAQDGKLVTYAGNSVEILLELRDGQGQALPYSESATLAATLTDAAGAAQTGGSAPDATAERPDRAEVTVTFTAPALPGYYRLTIDVDDTTFGPYAVQVKTP